MKDQICVGVVGAGIISDIYLKNMTGRFDNLRVKSVSARRVDKAVEKDAKYGLTGCSVDEMLSDPEVEMVVNLTPVSAHEEIIRKALEAGKHVYTEKTMTDNFDSAVELCRLADRKGPKATSFSCRTAKANWAPSTAFCALASALAWLSASIWAWVCARVNRCPS